MFIELLTEKDKQLIDFFREMGVEDTSMYSPNFVSCDYFLRFWEQSKSYFFKHIFKDKLIIKKKIDVVMEDDDLHEKMSKVINSDAFIQVEQSIISMLSINNDLFKKDNKNYTTILEYLRDYLFNVDGLISNRYKGQTLELILPNSKVFKLTHGCKLMKALGRLAKEANNEEKFEEIRILQSQVLNEAHISATLCLSIHPLDYITASYNYCDWDSCMCWEEGDYRRGVIEMMNSEFVMVAYLESDSQTMKFDTCGEELYWNSKKWREFFIVSEQGIFGVKGYPYWNHDIEDIVLQTIKQILVQNGFNQYCDSITRWSFNYNDIIHPHFSCGPAMYNDFYDGNTYHAIISQDLSGDFYINYSGESECVVCGEADNCFEDEGSSLGCENCCSRHYCSRCEELITDTDDIWYFDGEEYCSFCYNHCLIRCDCCEDIIPDYKPSFRFLIGKIKDNKIISLINKPRGYFNNESSPQDFHICEDCVEETFVKNEREFDEEHLKYRPPFTPDILDVIDYKNIKDLAYLNIEPSSLKSFLNDSSENE